MAYCRKCGTEVPEDAKLCSKCGAELAEKPGCFMLAMGPTLIVLGLTTLFGVVGTIVGLVIAAVVFLIYAVNK